MTTCFAYSSNRTPPIPSAVLTVSSPDGARSVVGLEGHFDTAADSTVVRLPVVHQLGVRPERTVAAHGFGGAVYQLAVYRVRVSLPGVADVVVDALGHSQEPYVLVGRDVLNRFRVTFDGPNESAEFH